jgi:hypothetical protein
MKHSGPSSVSPAAEIFDLQGCVQANTPSAAISSSQMRKAKAAFQIEDFAKKIIDELEKRQFSGRLRWPCPTRRGANRIGRPDF